MSTSPELQFAQAAGCLLVTATGRYLVENKELAVKSMVVQVQASSAKAILIDLRGLTPPFSFMDRYQFGELIGTHLRHVPVSALTHRRFLDPGMIGRLVARNRGARVEVFTDEAAAHAWLNQYQTPAP
jgi:hypothetical protein